MSINTAKALTHKTSSRGAKLELAHNLANHLTTPPLTGGSSTCCCQGRGTRRSRRRERASCCLVLLVALSLVAAAAAASGAATACAVAAAGAPLSIRLLLRHQRAVVMLACLLWGRARDLTVRIGRVPVRVKRARNGMRAWYANTVTLSPGCACFS